jgi:diguanylate cyclase (GGDEF)-like protein/PAS domain S-box-containing protein
LDPIALLEITAAADAFHSRQPPPSLEDAIDAGASLELRSLALFRDDKVAASADQEPPFLVTLRRGCERHLALLGALRAEAAPPEPGLRRDQGVVDGAELPADLGEARDGEPGVRDPGELDAFLRAAPELLLGVLDAVRDGVYIVDRERRILYWNAAASRIAGLEPADVVGFNCWDNRLCHSDARGVERCSEECPLEAAMEGGTAREADLYLRHRSGHRVQVAVTVQPIASRGGRALGAVHVFREVPDDSKLDLCRVELERLAYLDCLTGLANRRYLEQALVSRLDELQRYGWGFGLIFMDVDHFKRVNDRHGHPAGDRLLRTIGRTLAANVRLSDLVGRWGGDEFVVILGGVERARLETGANKLMCLVEQSQTWAGRSTLRATVSGGAALARPEDTVESLLSRCDELMYASKRSGGGRISVEPAEQVKRLGNPEQRADCSPWPASRPREAQSPASR